MAKKKTKKLTQKVSQLQKKAVHHDLPKKVAKGAAGLAVTAGVVAAGAALMDPDIREKVTEKAGQGLDMLKEAANSINQEEPQSNHRIGHDVPRGKKRRKH